MEPALEAIQRRVAPAGPDQFVVAAVLDEASAVDGDDAVGIAHGRQTVRDDDDGSPFGDMLHFLFDDVFALVIEGAGRLVQNQDARVGDESAGNGNTLALTA